MSIDKLYQSFSSQIYLCPSDTMLPFLPELYTLYYSVYLIIT